MIRYKDVHTLGFGLFLLCLTLIAPTVVMAETNLFYGGQSLNSLITGEKALLNLPGGAKMTIAGQETNYTLTDHLRSGRLAIKLNTISEPITYTPFGDTENESNLTHHYTGMTFEPETDTYNYHARSYDGSTARFTGVDAIRKSISPYSYTANNPINFVDPTGLGKIHVWLYSASEEETTRFRRIFNLLEGLRQQQTPFIQAVELENDQQKIILKPGDQIEHLTVSIQSVYTPRGSRGNVYTNTGGVKSYMEADAFALYLHEKLEAKAPGSSEGIKSIMLDSCCLAQNGFANELVHYIRAERTFPNLKKIMMDPFYSVINIHVPMLVSADDINNAKPAALQTYTGHWELMRPKGSGSKLTVKSSANIFSSVSRKPFYVREIEMKDYFSGNIPPEWFKQPTSKNVSFAGNYTRRNIFYTLRHSQEERGEEFLLSEPASFEEIKNSPEGMHLDLFLRANAHPFNTYTVNP